MLYYTSDTDSGRIVLQDEVLAVFNRFRQRRRWQAEAGGQLFARFEGATTVVVEATPPSRFDLRRRMSFEPHRAAQQRQIHERFRRGLHFVGDWHSHPELDPTPSSLDVTSMKECLRRSRHDLKGLLLIIVGARCDVDNLWVGIVTMSDTVRLMNTKSHLTASTEQIASVVRSGSASEDGAIRAHQPTRQT